MWDLNSRCLRLNRQEVLVELQDSWRLPIKFKQIIVLHLIFIEEENIICV